MKVEGYTSAHTCDFCNKTIDFTEVRIIKMISYSRNPNYTCNSYNTQSKKLLELCDTCYRKMFSNVSVDYSTNRGGCRTQEC